MILCSETMIMWNENTCNYNEIMQSGLERMTSGVTSSGGWSIGGAGAPPPFKLAPFNMLTIS